MWGVRRYEGQIDMLQTHLVLEQLVQLHKRDRARVVRVSLTSGSVGINVKSRSSSHVPI